MIHTIMLICLVLFFFLPQANAEFYRWKDGEGREFYTNEKDKIPSEYRNTAKPVEIHDERVAVSRTSQTAEPSSKPSEHRDRYGRGEEYWHRRAENLRRQIREQQSDLDLLSREEREEANKTLSAKTRKKAHAVREKKRVKIEKKIARLRHELEVELPEEARKADAWPGWIRE